MKYFPLIVIVVVVLSSCNRSISKIEEKEKEESGKSMQQWYGMRSYPNKTLAYNNFEKSYFDSQNYPTETVQASCVGSGEWKNIGPYNFAGRTLCMAFHPTQSNTFWVGTAGGGLWKTTTAGIGTKSWNQVPIPFPALSIMTIAISPDGNTIYIGTGEVYNYANTGLGRASRLLRGTYGIGILKSTDGGNTWTKSLDWNYDNLHGVQDIKINPLKPSTVYACTSEGLYRSYNAGTTWSLINPNKMAVDLVINPIDTNIIYTSFGSLYDNVNGIYKSTNAGNSFTKFTSANGLPDTYTGKAKICISNLNPNILYASIANQTESIGMYKTINGGAIWTQVNNSDIAQYQGWYSHDVAVDPTDSDHIIYVGIDAFLSYSGGNNIQQTSNWFNWYFGKNPVGGPEGPNDYVHADIHEAYFKPGSSSEVYLATDGGVFYSGNGGSTWAARNGGFSTLQFYANIGISNQSDKVMIGGMQDNSTAIYDGDSAWTRVIGGDGMHAAINSQNDSIMYGSYQYLGLSRSTNKGLTFSGSNMGLNVGETAFNAPFQLAPSNQNIIYAAGQKISKSLDRGISYTNPSLNEVDSTNFVLTLEISPSDPNIVYFSTFPNGSSIQAKLFKSINGTAANTLITNGLPDRVVTDIFIDSSNIQRVYITLSGFGTEHVYKTIDGGLNWNAITGFPDVPTNSIYVDTRGGNEVFYVANDIGLYKKTGSTVTKESLGLPNAVYGMQIMHKNGFLYLATHGNGIYKRNIDIPAGQTVLNGKVTNPNNDPIVGATIVFAIDSIVNTLASTNTTGNFSINSPMTFAKNAIVPLQPYPNSPYIPSAYYPYKLNGFKNGDVLNGVTTLDITIINKSILGLIPALTGYEFIAADVNNSKTLTSLDMLAIRKLILRKDTAFQNMPSWVLFPISFDPTNGFVGVPTNLAGNYLFHPCSGITNSTYDFKAIKIGDPNYTANPNLLASTAIIRGNKDPIYFYKNDENAFIAKDKIKLYSFQMALNIGKSKNIELKSTLENFGTDNYFYNPSNGILTISYNVANGIEIEKNQTVFQLNSDFDIDNNYIENEWQTDNKLNFAVIKAMQKEFEVQKKMEGDILILSFENDLATENIVKIYSNDGKLKKELSQFNPKGTSEFKIQLNDLPNGVFILELHSNNRFYTTKINYYH